MENVSLMCIDNNSTTMAATVTTMMTISWNLCGGMQHVACRICVWYNVHGVPGWMLYYCPEQIAV